MSDRLNSPMFFLACAFALGIWITRECHQGLAVFLLASGACLATGLIAYLRNRRAAAALAVFLGFVFAGASAGRLFAHRFPPDDISHLSAWGINLDRPLRLQGMVLTNPVPTPYGLECDLRVSRLWSAGQARAATGKIRLRILNGRKSGKPAVLLHLHYGEWIRFRAPLNQPQNYANPGSFDYRRWLESIQDITWEATVQYPSLVHKIAGPAPPWLSRLVERVRMSLLASIDRLYPPWTAEGRDGAVLKAVLLGDRSSLDASTVQNFRKSGLYHLLVVAGLHVGLLALLVEGLLRLVEFRPTWRALSLIAFLIVYSMLVEQRAPTLRASLMIGAYLIARLLDRHQPVLNAVGIAALVLLLHRPAWLFDAGFELSFAAALLIAGLALPILERVTEPYRRGLWHLEEPALDRDCPARVAQFRLDARSAADWLDGHSAYLKKRPSIAVKMVASPLKAAVWALDLLLFSLILQFGLLLPMAQIFHRVTLAGFGLNVLAIPCMTLLLAVAAPVVVLNVFAPSVALLPSRLLALIMHGLFLLTETPYLPHWLSYRVPAPPAWVEWGFVLGILGAALLIRLDFRAGAACLAGAACFALLTALAPFPPKIPSGIFQVTDLDCAGGEALFIVLPDRTTLLAGACGGSWLPASGGDPLRVRRWDPGEDIVSPYLWLRGIQTIDVFLLPDSSGGRLSGVAAILKNFRVRAFWSAPLPSQSSSASLLELLERRKVRIRLLNAGEKFTVHHTSIQVLGPRRAAPQTTHEADGRSVALMISNSSGCLLLAGDLDEMSQQGLVESHAGFRCRVLEAPAEGERADVIPAFAARVQPAAALIDSYQGLWNAPASLPNSTVLDRMGVRLFDTSIRGAVTVDMKSRRVSIHTYRQEN